MEARQKAAEKMKKLSRTKTDSVESNSMEGEAASSKEGSNPEFWKNEKRFRFFIRRICKTSAWFWFVIVLVFLNTCTVAVEHYNQPKWLTEFLCKCIIIRVLISNCSSSMPSLFIFWLIFQFMWNSCFWVPSSLKCWFECMPWVRWLSSTRPSTDLTPLLSLAPSSKCSGSTSMNAREVLASLPSGLWDCSEYSKLQSKY